ncbi:hypothetical protein [Flavihumibacter fluvii]|uniref:hypothetical protein n=1 Tax=Flavihumibacter fluvii TaxID=2838157 RepID=UPI001BDE61B6|nr:hypothetical protein [Flavihumibacter fluvii]ULQ52789.1 hypothetical protein KJS93_00450 [Flavihumibacter fluvii]
MKKEHVIQYLLLLVVSAFASGSCTGSPDRTKAGDIILAASTPADSPILAMLGIQTTGTIDFIRWHLTLRPDKTFTADLKYGEAKPNTLGFKQDNHHMLAGHYNPGEVYTFTSNQPAASFRLQRLNDQVYHLLTSDGKMMTGNGGWGYCLNRVQDGTVVSKELPRLLPTARLEEDSATHLTFDGRTPCIELAKDHRLAVQPDCFKIKWRVILNRDPVTLAPTTYILKTVNRRADSVGGKWAIIKGIPAQPNAIIYQLDPDKPEESMSFLVLDEQVILFLRRDYSLYVGNADFSYSLNRNLNR